MDIKPCDRTGAALAPFDLVLTSDIPAHYWADENFSELKYYGHSVGLVSYYKNEAHYFGDPTSSGWCDSKKENVNVKCVRISKDFVASYSFWLPTGTLEKIPFNPIAFAIFADVPLCLEYSDGRAEWQFGVNTEFFKLVRKVTSASKFELSQLRDAYTQFDGRG